MSLLASFSSSRSDGENTRVTRRPLARRCGRAGWNQPLEVILPAPAGKKSLRIFHADEYLSEVFDTQPRSISMQHPMAIRAY